LPETITRAISSGIAALARMQADDGSFPFFTRLETTAWKPCGRLFSTAYIMLGAGKMLPRDSIARAVSFIASQRRPDRLWEYDPHINVPPEADSTACALAALKLHSELPDPDAEARLLRTFWRADAGRFRTWNVPGPWSLPERDDPVVNCNVLYALKLLGSPATAEETLAVCRFLNKCGPARYYCAPSTVAHAARRAGLGNDELPPFATAQPAETALIGCVQWLCGTGTANSRIIDAVLAAQQADGSWPIRPWVTGAGRPRPFWGSRALTTALAVEALASTQSSPLPAVAKSLHPAP
jgi:hypothetical protein